MAVGKWSAPSLPPELPQFSAYKFVNCHRATAVLPPRLPALLPRPALIGGNARVRPIHPLARCCGRCRCHHRRHLGQRPMFLPAARGFDHYLGVPYSVDVRSVPLPGEDDTHIQCQQRWP